LIYSTSERPPRPDKPGRIRRYRLGKGLALGTVSGADYLFATDLHNGKVDVFDTAANERPLGSVATNLLLINEKLVIDAVLCYYSSTSYY
jgi:hypothetical protein